MAEVSKFFNAVLKDGKYDREHLASDFADYFRKVLSAGLLLDDNGEYGLQVTTVNGLDVNVAPGSALIKGYSYDNTTNKTLAHNLPESDKDRIDRVVLRLDLRNQSRFIKTFVKEGVSDTSPKPPELQRDDYIYELSLAQVRLRANTASINASDVIDERADEKLCGIVQSLITVPTSIFQQQFTAWFNDRKKVYEQEMNNWKDSQKQDFESWSSGERNSFDEWFESIKGALKGDIAADLASRMTSTEIKLENLQEDNAAHLADDMPHQYTDSVTGKTYKWGLGAENGELYFIREETT